MHIRSRNLVAATTPHTRYLKVPYLKPLLNSILVGRRGRMDNFAWHRGSNSKVVNNLVLKYGHRRVRARVRDCLFVQNFA